MVRGLVKSDHCEAERRLSPKEAIMMLEVEGLALAWTQLEEAQKEAKEAKQQLVVLQQQAGEFKSPSQSAVAPGIDSEQAA